MRQQELAQAESRKRNLRIGALVVGGIVAVIGLVWIASAVTSDDGEEQPPDTTVLEQPTTSTSATTVPVTTGG
jgi:hypothetical protein